MNKPTVSSQVILNGDAQRIAQALIMTAPSPDYAAGVVAMAIAIGAASGDMAGLISDRWQFWAVSQIERS